MFLRTYFELDGRRPSKAVESVRNDGPGTRTYGMCCVSKHVLRVVPNLTPKPFCPSAQGCPGVSRGYPG